MTPEERQLLNGLFERMGAAANAPRDREAEALIADQVRAQPYAPYLMAQTVIIQEEALKAAASRIQELENQLKEREQGGSFLGGLGRSVFGNAAEPRPTSVPRSGPWGAAPPPPQPPQPAPGPWGAPQQGNYGGGGFGGGAPAGGGFLRSAMTTAAGVAGGALLFQGISSLFGGHHASSLLSDASSGLTGQAGSLGDQFFGDNSVLGGATPAPESAGLIDNSAPDDGSYAGDDDTDVGYDDGGDLGGDDSGSDWA